MEKEQKGNHKKYFTKTLGTRSQNSALYLRTTKLDG